MTVARTIAVSVATIAALAVAAWSADSVQYRACVNAAEAATPVLVLNGDRGSIDEDRPQAVGVFSRRQAVRSCERWLPGDEPSGPSVSEQLEQGVLNGP